MVLVKLSGADMKDSFTYEFHENYLSEARLMSIRIDFYWKCAEIRDKDNKLIERIDF